MLSHEFRPYEVIWRGAQSKQSVPKLHVLSAQSEQLVPTSWQTPSFALAQVLLQANVVSGRWPQSKQSDP